MNKQRKTDAGETRGSAKRRQQGSASAVEPGNRTRRTWLVVGGGALTVAALLVAGLVVLGTPSVAPTTAIVSTNEGTVNEGTVANQGASAGQSIPVGTAVGDRPPDFEMTGINGETVSRASLLGGPSLLWFTTSYCLPCAEGALRLQDVLDKIGSPADELEVVIIFVDGGDPPAALEDWQNRYGRPEWTIAYSTGSMIRDFRLAYLDTKYLVGRDGVIDVADFVPLQTGPWERDLRTALADTA